MCRANMYRFHLDDRILAISMWWLALWIPRNLQVFGTEILSPLEARCEGNKQVWWSVEKNGGFQNHITKKNPHATKNWCVFCTFCTSGSGIRICPRFRRCLFLFSSSRSSTWWNMDPWKSQPFNGKSTWHLPLCCLFCFAPWPCHV